MHPEELLIANLALLDRAVAAACRRYQLSPEDQDELAGVVRLRLVENDYAILRAYEGRSSLATFLSVVVQRMALDYRIHAWGKWHASAEAKRLGEVAIELEQFLHRERRTFDEAVPALTAKFPKETRESLRALADRLPARGPKVRDVPLDDARAASLAQHEDAEAMAMAGERRSTADRVGALMSAAIDQLPEDDRLVLQLRFEDGMTVAQIARALHLDQKLLYRRIERRMRELRKQVESTGIAAADVLDLIGRDDGIVRFELRKRPPRPSMGRNETAASHPEDL